MYLRSLPSAFEHSVGLILTRHELRHWPSIAGMSPQSHRGDAEDERMELSL